MVQTALETVEVQQFAVYRQRVLIPLLTQRQIPSVQTIHTFFRDSSCDTVTRRCTFPVEQDEQATGAGRSEDSRDPSSLTGQ